MELIGYFLNLEFVRLVFEVFLFIWVKFILGLSVESLDLKVFLCIGL